MDDDLIWRARPTVEQTAFTNNYIRMCGGVGKRDDFNGDTFQQNIGILGQVVLGDRLGLPRPIPSSTMDGGVDFSWKGKTWDLKCKVTSCPHKSSYPHNLAARQLDYQNDGYVFASYNKTAGVFEFLGWIMKEDFKKKAHWFAQGVQRPRSDGTAMQIKNVGGMYEIKDRALRPMDQLRMGLFERPIGVD